MKSQNPKVDKATASGNKSQESPGTHHRDGGREGPRPRQARPARSTPGRSDPGTPTAQPQAGASLLVTRAHGASTGPHRCPGPGPLRPPSRHWEPEDNREVGHTPSLALGGLRGGPRPEASLCQRGGNRQPTPGPRAEREPRGGEDREQGQVRDARSGGTRPHSREVSTKDGLIKHEPRMTSAGPAAAGTGCRGLAGRLDWGSGSAVAPQVTVAGGREDQQ